MILTSRPRIERPSCCPGTGSCNTASRSWTPSRVLQANVNKRIKRRTRRGRNSFLFLVAWRGSLDFHYDFYNNGWGRFAVEGTRGSFLWQNQQATYIAVVKLVRITGHVTTMGDVSSVGCRFYYRDRMSIDVRMDLIGREILRSLGLLIDDIITPGRLLFNLKIRMFYWWIEKLLLLVRFLVEIFSWWCFVRLCFRKYIMFLRFLRYFSLSRNN